VLYCEPTLSPDRESGGKGCGAGGDEEKAEDIRSKTTLASRQLRRPTGHTSSLIHTHNTFRKVTVLCVVEVTMTCPKTQDSQSQRTHLLHSRDQTKIATEATSSTTAPSFPALTVLKLCCWQASKPIPLKTGRPIADYNHCRSQLAAARRHFHSNMAEIFLERSAFSVRVIISLYTSGRVAGSIFSALSAVWRTKAHQKGRKKVDARDTCNRPFVLAGRELWSWGKTADKP